MDHQEKEELLNDIFAIIAEQISMLFDNGDDMRMDIIALREAVDMLGFRADMDKEDFHRLATRVDHLET